VEKIEAESSISIPLNKQMSQFDLRKDYYQLLGADETATRRDIERLYKRLAARLHPDRGGSEEDMKSLNEAYRVLKDESTRRDYDDQRRRPTATLHVPATTAPARDVGSFGQGLSAFLCLLLGLFLLMLVRFQFMWFLWPLAILAVGVIVFGVFLARGAMQAFNNSLPASSGLRGHNFVWEAIFWTIIGGAGYGLYLLLATV